ncbi:hypothetical protein ACUIAC_08915 [Dermabacteraceae bacterium P13138]
MSLAALHQKGVLPIDNSVNSNECLKAFSEWVEKLERDVKNANFNFKGVQEFYDSLQAEVVDYGKLTPRFSSNDPGLTDHYMWIDPTIFRVTEEFMDGFFSYKHPQCVKPFVTCSQISTWSELEKQLKEALAAGHKMLPVWDIEMSIFDPNAGDGLPTAVFGTGGRHRIAAALALKAPVIPINDPGRTMR